jgi:hypothetical protein
MYFDKLAPRGIITMNISNRFLDLRPVLAAIGKELGFAVYFKFHEPEVTDDKVSKLYTKSLFAVMAKDERDIAPFAEKYGWKPYNKQVKVRAWTDDYANIIGSFNGVR